MTVSKTKKKFAFDVGWVFFASVVALFIRFLRKTVLARYLGPADLGLFSMCLTVGSIITLVAGFGVESAVIKYVAECKGDKNKISQLLSSALITMIILGIFSSAILFVLSSTLADIFNMPSLSLLLKIFGIAFPFTLITTIIFGLLNGLRKMNYFSYANISRASFAFIFILIPILIGLGVGGAVLGYVLAEIIIAGIFIAFIRKYIHFTVRACKQTAKKLISFGSRMVGANAVNMITNQVDILLIGYFLTATEVGYYAIAVALAGLLSFLPQAVQKITYPTTSEYWSSNDIAGLNKMINKSMKYSACFLLLVGLGMGFYAREIITIIFGGDFIYATLPLRVLLIARIIRGSTIVPIGGSLAGVGRPDLSLKTDSVSAIANIMLNILLIPPFGILGAAIATTTSLILGTIIFLIFTVKTLSVQIDIKWYSKFFGLALTTVLLFLFGIKLGSPYLVGSIVLCISAILILRFFLTEEDRDMFKSLTLSLIYRR